MIRVHSEICPDCVRRMKALDEANRGRPPGDREAFVPCWPCLVDQELASAVFGLLGSLTYGAKDSATRMIATWREGMR